MDRDHQSPNARRRLSFSSEDMETSDNGLGEWGEWNTPPPGVRGTPSRNNTISPTPITPESSPGSPSRFPTPSYQVLYEGFGPIPIIAPRVSPGMATIYCQDTDGYFFVVHLPMQQLQLDLGYDSSETETEPDSQ